MQVWDYASDGYVHRLVQSKTDGKLVEVPSPAQPAYGERHSAACPECVPATALETTASYLLMPGCTCLYISCLQGHKQLETETEAQTWLKALHSCAVYISVHTLQHIWYVCK